MKKLDNKGLTLVEMMISIAIFAVIMASVFSVLTIATRSSNKNNIEVNVQNEAQALINQLDNILADAAEVKTTTNGAFVDEFAEYDAATKKWNIVNNVLVLSEGKVYYMPNALYSSSGVSDTYLLSEDVKDFSVDTANLKKYGYVTVAFSVEKNSRKFAVNKNVFIRNYKTDRK